MCISASAVHTAPARKYKELQCTHLTGICSALQVYLSEPDFISATRHKTDRVESETSVSLLRPKRPGSLTKSTDTPTARKLLLQQLQQQAHASFGNLTTTISTSQTKRVFA
jgi:hypothetical protein